jgi:hypothetical protein
MAIPHGRVYHPRYTGQSIEKSKRSSLMEGPSLDMMEVERHARLEKRRKALDIRDIILAVFSMLSI